MIERIEMISRRLSKTQKSEILEAYMAGENSNFLAEKYNCTTNTINRTVKTLLSENEYTLLKEKRSKISNKKRKTVDSSTAKETKKDLAHSNSFILTEEIVTDDDLTIELSEKFDTFESDKIDSLPLEDTDPLREDLISGNKYINNDKTDKNNHNTSNDFEVIEPLISDFDFEQEKKSVFEILHFESLPESVYMIVDKKVELDLKLISDLPEWSFLPENELKRNAILLFFNQRTAKRSCSRHQRVIKIPNTSVFKLSKSYLITKGITRLILEDSIIALDN